MRKVRYFIYSTKQQSVPFAKCEVSVPNSSAAARTLAIAASISGVIASRSAMHNRDFLETDDDEDDDDDDTNAIAGDSRTTTTIERMMMMDDFMVR